MQGRRKGLALTGSSDGPLSPVGKARQLSAGGEGRGVDCKEEESLGVIQEEGE